MRTVSAFEARRTAGQAFSGGITKVTASPPRGAIGAGLFLLVSLFLLAAGAVPSAPESDDAGAREAGAFLLDPSVTAAQG